jgi:hypothetical protein
MLWSAAEIGWDAVGKDPLDPVPEHLAASIAAFEAMGGFMPATGSSLDPKAEAWDALPRKEQRRLVRRASRLLELFPFGEDMRDDDLRAIERYKRPMRSEDNRGPVPTPYQWLMGEMRRRRHLAAPTEEGLRSGRLLLGHPIRVTHPVETDEPLRPDRRYVFSVERL